MLENDKIVNIKSYKKKNNKNHKMIIIIALISALLAIFIWNNFIVLGSYKDLPIDESKMISYDSDKIQEITPLEIINKIERSAIDNRPTLLFFYTSWCSACKKQLPVINEIAKKYQNTDLKVIVVTIDNDVIKFKAISGLKNLENIYFEPNYLVHRADFKDLLRSKSIIFNNRIPFSVILDRNSQIIAQFSGYKRFGFINRKIKKSLLKIQEDEII